MLFNSFVFIQFAALFFAGWWYVKKRPTARYVYLIAFSFLFYSWSTPWWLLLLIGDGLVDYAAGLAMGRYRRWRALFLGLSLCGNLGLLFVFKYSYFLGVNTNAVFAFFGSGLRVPLAQLALPIGISFYTFQSLSYTISVYRGTLGPARNLLQFFAYISLWPQLVAGPIERAGRLLPQLAAPARLTPEIGWEGFVLIVGGFFKKMVIADNLAPSVNAAFNMPSVSHDIVYWWVILTMFALQIYCDFSGYTDIARGLAKWMGFEFMLNFDHPYGAVSVRDFWRCWHISLSTWFRDYVYVPLGGAKGSMATGIRNLWITMLVSAIWHGAAWTFVAWGALHAFYLTIERATQWPDRLLVFKCGRPFAALLTFVLVTLAWVFFRATSIEQALGIVGAMLDVTTVRPSALVETAPQALFFFALGMGMVLNDSLRLTNRISVRFPTAELLRPVAVGLLAMACVFWRGPGAAFIYFQF